MKSDFSKMTKAELIVQLQNLEEKTGEKTDDLSLESALQKIQSELIAPKDKYNSFGKYKYRSAEGILEALKPLLDKYDCVLLLTDCVKQTGDFVYCEATAEILKDGKSVVVKAQAGIPESKKGMDLSQIFGTSSSYARKYALNGLFLIDDSKDADSDEHHRETNRSKSFSNDADNKPWLNESTEAFKKAVEYIKNGGDIDTIRTKYKISKAVEQKLKQ